MSKQFNMFVLFIFSLVLISGCSSTGENDDNNNAFIGLQLNTTPGGATIYLDGTNLLLNTPALIEPDILLPGEHHIRLYLDSYNEINVHFTYELGEGLTFDYEMQEPQSPLPVIDITAPVDNQDFADNVIMLQGLIVMEDRSPYAGEIAILNHNGMDWMINVNQGVFDQEISIASGLNEIWLRANSENGDTGTSDLISVYGDFETPDIELVLTWNTSTSDLDLHIWNPLGEHCYYDNMVISEGSLVTDATEGYGPETFTALSALLGTYVVSVNSYDLDEDLFAAATLQLIFQGDLYELLGPHQFCTYDYNGSDPESWWEALEFTVVEGRISSHTEPVSEEIRSKIKADIKGLSSK